MTGGLWFISDLHLQHGLVHRLRAEKGMAMESEHDARLAENWDRVVKPGDQVWLLGDVIANKRREVETAALDWIWARPGVKHLIAGNHDPVFAGHRDSHAALAVSRGWISAFASIQMFARRRILGTNVLLSHFPYPTGNDGADDQGRPFDDRYKQYRLPDQGVTLLHGHTHRSDVVTHTDAGTMQIHIGVDAHDLRPVPLSAIEDWMSATYVKRK